LMIVLKPVFIIAIVAVAMIGVMVPSVFAQIEVTVTPYKESYHIDEPNYVIIKLSETVPNTSLCYEIVHDEDRVMSKSSIDSITSNRAITFDENDNPLLDLSFISQRNIDGKYIVKVFYGSCDVENSFGNGSTQIILEKEPSKITKFIQDNYFPEKIDVGLNFEESRFAYTGNFLKVNLDGLGNIESSVGKTWNSGEYSFISVFISKIEPNVLESGNWDSDKQYGDYHPFNCLVDDSAQLKKGDASKQITALSCHHNDMVVQVLAYSIPNTHKQISLFMDVVLKKINATPIPSSFNPSSTSSSQSMNTSTQESILEKTYNNSKNMLEIAPFVDTTKDPQHYIDRYNNEPTYKEWFDENYSQYSSIYEAVGLEEPVVGHAPEPEYIPEPTVEVADTSNCGVGTESVNGICTVIQTEEKSDNGGGCLIATATYGSELSPQVQQLRELRDNQLMNTESGTQFMGTFNDFYYSFSPVIADYERENPLFKEVVKLAITPMISSLSLMENAESESEVLGIGISVIMLNLGMYLGVPAVVIVGIRKRI